MSDTRSLVRSSVLPTAAVHRPDTRRFYTGEGARITPTLLCHLSPLNVTLFPGRITLTALMKMRLTLQVMMTWTRMRAKTAQFRPVRDLSARKSHHTVDTCSEECVCYICGSGLRHDGRFKVSVQKQERAQGEPFFSIPVAPLPSPGCNTHQPSGYNPGVWQLPHLPHAAVAELPAGRCACPPAPVCGPP